MSLDSALQHAGWNGVHMLRQMEGQGDVLALLLGFIHRHVKEQGAPKTETYHQIYLTADG